MVQVYKGIYYLSKLDLRGIEWLCRQMKGYEKEKLEGFLKLIDRKAFYEREIK